MKKYEECLVYAFLGCLLLLLGALLLVFHHSEICGRRGVEAGQASFLQPAVADSSPNLLPASPALCSSPLADGRGPLCLDQIPDGFRGWGERIRQNNIQIMGWSKTVEDRLGRRIGLSLDLSGSEKDFVPLYRRDLRSIEELGREVEGRTVAEQEK